MMILFSGSTFARVEDETTPEKPVDIDEIVSIEQAIDDYLHVYDPTTGVTDLRVHITGTFVIDYNPSTG